MTVVGAYEKSDDPFSRLTDGVSIRRRNYKPLFCSAGHETPHSHETSHSTVGTANGAITRTSVYGNRTPKSLNGCRRGYLRRYPVPAGHQRRNSNVRCNVQHTANRIRKNIDCEKNSDSFSRQS